MSAGAAICTENAEEPAFTRRLHDQHVYTCQDKAYAQAGDMGSIEHRSFRELWFSDEHRERLHAFDPRSQCRHHCVTHSKNLSILEYLSIDPEHAVFV